MFHQREWPAGEEPGPGDEIQALLALTLQADEPRPRMLLPDEASAILGVLPGARSSGDVLAMLTKLVHTGRDPRLFDEQDRAVRWPRQYPTMTEMSAALERGELAPSEGGGSGPGGWTRVRPRPVARQMTVRARVPARVVLTQVETGEIWERQDGDRWRLQAMGEQGRPTWLRAIDDWPMVELVELIVDRKVPESEVIRQLRLSPWPWDEVLREAVQVAAEHVSAARVRRVQAEARAVMPQTELQPHRLVLHVVDEDLAAESHEADAELAGGTLVLVHRAAATMIRHRGRGWWPASRVWPDRAALLAEMAGLLEQPRPGMAWLVEPVDETPQVGGTEVSR